MFIVRDCSFRRQQAARTQFSVGTGKHKIVLRNLPVVWISITRRDESPRKILDDSIPFFPAVIDTGTTAAVFLHEWHLENWAQVPFDTLPTTGKPTINPMDLEDSASSVSTDVWIHPLKPGQLQPDDVRSAIKILVSRGTRVSHIPCRDGFGAAKIEKAIEAPPLWPPWQWLFGASTPVNPPPIPLKVVEDYLAAEAHNDYETIPHGLRPRLPVLGMKAFVNNRWNTNLHSVAQHFSIEKIERLEQEEAEVEDD